MCGKQGGRWKLDSKTEKVASLSPGPGNLVNEDEGYLQLQLFFLTCCIIYIPKLPLDLLNYQINLKKFQLARDQYVFIFSGGVYRPMDV